MSVKIGRNDPCWCGSGRKYKTCHQSFDEKIEKYREAGCIVPTHDLIKTPKDIEGIRESAKINVAVLDYVAEHIKAGMSTEEIDRMVYEKTTAMGGIPAPLNYQGFPKSVCTSINEEVCHGIPSEDIILKDGDIINVDVSTILERCLQGQVPPLEPPRGGQGAQERPCRGRRLPPPLPRRVAGCRNALAPEYRLSLRRQPRRDGVYRHGAHRRHHAQAVYGKARPAQLA